MALNKQRQAKNYFIALLVSFVIISLFVYRNYRISQDLKLQTLRNKIASDLHDEVGSTLSSIAIFSEVAQQQSREVIPLLATINESARKMLDAMADIVWTINPENDQFEKIILRMRSFAYELLGAKQIEFKFEADDDIGNIKLPMSARKNLYLIFKEATNNLVKYAEASHANFSINGTRDNLSMVISDNGKGFDLNKQGSGNGLKNMRMRAEEIGARILIESAPDKGTTIHLLLNLA
jgi:signal transduction histidine kinase